MQRLRRLVRRSSARASERAYVAEGVRVVTAALEAGAPVEGLYVAAEDRTEPPVEELVARAAAGGIRVFELGVGVMEKVADTVTPQGVLAVVTERDVALEALAAETVAGERLLVVCAEVRDPGNLGGIVRSAAGAGARGVVCTKATTDPYGPKAVRAAAGALFSLPVVRAGDTAEVLAQLRHAGYRIVATTARDGTDYAAADLSGDVALVLGNEAAGLSDELLSEVDERVTIPLYRGTESLNVAMTAAVLCHEIARRRRLSGERPPTP